MEYPLKLAACLFPLTIYNAMCSDLICLFYLASGFQLSSRRLSVDEDLDLNVDGDDTELYGRPQYPLLWSTFNQTFT